MTHLSTKQLWVQEAIQSSGVEVRKVPRAEHVSDIPTPSGDVRIQAGRPVDGIRTPLRRSVWVTRDFILVSGKRLRTDGFWKNRDVARWGYMRRQFERRWPKKTTLAVGGCFSFVAGMFVVATGAWGDGAQCYNVVWFIGRSSVLYGSPSPAALRAGIRRAGGRLP